MKNIIVFVLSFTLLGCSAQRKMTNYNSLWKNVDELADKKGLPASALAEVKKIYSLAKKEKNDAQLIRALLYQVRLTETNTEDADQKNFDLIRRELSEAKEPARSLLHSVLASAYYGYFQENRWKLYDRTMTTGPKTEDIETWNADDLHAAISEHYLKSLKEKDLLLKQPLSQYETVINKGNARQLRPTLYDLLAHTALRYFTNPERDIRQTTKTFEINDPKAFAEAETFSKHRFAVKDSSSLYYRAIQIYQELTAIHITDPKPDALIDLELNRLLFMYSHSIPENKTELYKNALQALEQKYSGNPASAQAGYLRAQLMYQSSMQGIPETDNRNAARETRILCEKIIAKHPGSEGAINCSILLRDILRKELAMQVEKVNLPEKPFRVYVSFKNVKTLHYRIIPVTETFFENNRERWDDKFWNQLTGLKSIRSASQELPFADDHLHHSVEMKAGGLPVGRYALLVSSDADFSLRENPMSVIYFHVSSIAFINQGNDYFVLNRESGYPMAKASVQVWQLQYDYSNRRSKLIAREKLQSDQNGFIQLTSKDNRYEPIRLEIRHENDHLFLEEGSARVYSVQRTTLTDRETFEKGNKKTFLFTDRGIYRPGQTVHFKGISVTRDFSSKRYKVLENHPVKIILMNANGEKSDSLSFTTNSYGSYSGRFQLPASGLTGTFSLVTEDGSGYAPVQVEEYKRPLFYVEFEKLKREFQLNDTVTVTGFAKSYAGNAAGGALVRYRVVREPRFLYPWMSFSKGFPRSAPMEIAHGETVTEADGSFPVPFTLYPDKTIPANRLPVFDYRVIADVTDINGETRTGETTLTAGYRSLDLGIQLPDGGILETTGEKNITITTRNWSGEPQQVAYEMNILPLEAPQRLIRERYWPAADTFIYSREEYLRYFPYDEYREETDQKNWTRGKAVFTSKDSTRNGESRVPVKGNSLKPGWYLVRVTAEGKDGKEVSQESYVQVRDSRTGNDGSFAWFTSSKDKGTVSPGDTVNVGIQTRADELWIIRQLNPVFKKDLINGKETLFKPGDNGKTYHFFSLKEKQQFRYTIEEDDRGGFGIGYAFVKQNRIYFSEEVIRVPWTNKELDIKFTTWRDKTLPGSAEEWTVTVKGNKGEKWAAELLTSMYDASLDQFLPWSWSKPDIYPVYPENLPSDNRFSWQRNSGFSAMPSENRHVPEKEIKQVEKTYDELMWAYSQRIYGPMMKRGMVAMEAQAMRVSDSAADAGAPAPEMKQEELSAGQKPTPDLTGIKARSDFRETAFFFPDLKTDSEGNVRISFTTPEALTSWKWQVFAHTRDLALGLQEKTMITQKELMIQSNAPRFLREGDQTVLSAKLSNLTNKELTGQAQLQLIDAANGQVVDGLFTNIFPTQYFTVPAGQTSSVQFSMTIPYNFNRPLLYRILAKAENHTDGEEQTLPVLTNRMLVTETLPIQVKGSGTKTFTFDKLLKSESSPSLTHHSLTVEYSSNPAWYAVQALPYLTEFPYECAEQVFNRFYANALAASIVKSTPRIKDYYDRWKKDSVNGKQSALLSNLQKNQELKNILLEETPWVLDAKNENEQKQNIALLFDMVRIAGELEKSLNKLRESQTDNGGFVWFKGGPEDRFITQYILTGIGRLKKLGAIPDAQKEAVNAIAGPAFSYIHKTLKQDYENLKKRKADLNTLIPGDLIIQALYAMSYFKEYPVPGEYVQAIGFFSGRVQKTWLKHNRQSQAMAALALYRNNDGVNSRAILKSLKENSVSNETLGRYWKQDMPAFYWYQAPVETQALMIEAFAEIDKDDNTVNELKQWLLTQKQTRNWRTTKATADACYALLMQGTDWLSAETDVQIRLGSENPVIIRADEKAEAGTGYIKTVVEGKLIRPDLGQVEVTVSPNTKQPRLSWGAVYWQYFENLDQITTAGGPLQLKKQLYVERNTDKGPVLEPVEDGADLKTGDKLKVRIEIRADRDLEYVHLKDMRAAGSEPVNVLSGYKWQGGLGYYESTRDAATNFFFSYLPKGTWVFEYPLFISHEGNFSVGVSTIQCMYAPEFAAHSEGVRVKVKSKK